MWAQIQRDKIRDGHTILLPQLIADLTDEARRKDLPKSFASVNRPPGDSSRGRGNGRGRGNSQGRGSGGASRGTLSGNQGSTKDTSNKYR